MGANVYLESVASFGYKTEAAATAIVRNIAGKPGYRIAIRAFAFTCGATATTVYFMRSQGSTTLVAVAASGASELALTAQPVTDVTNDLAASDYVCVVQDNGTYHFSKVFSVVGFTVISLCTVTTGAAAIGQPVYDLGAFGDTAAGGAPCPYLLTVSVQTSEEIDGGIIYGSSKGSPMIVYHANDAAAAGKINYVTVDYINK